MKAILLVLGAVVGLALLGLWWGYAIHVLWAWFVVPLGVVPIKLAHAYGLSVLFGLFLNTRGLEIGKEKSSDDWATSVTVGVLMPAFALFLGWIAVGFM
jgi:hypothetical protein